MRHNYLAAVASASIFMGTPPEEWNITQLKQDIFKITGLNLPIEEWVKHPEVSSEDILQKLLTEVDAYIATKNAGIDANLVKLVEKSILLQTLDQLWKEHIATLDMMRHTIVLRAYGQKDPLNEYKKEAFNMFSDMLDLLKERVTVVICHTQIRQGSDEDIKAQEEQQKNKKLNAIDFNNPAPIAPENRTVADTTPEWKNISRNSPCPCGSGKKYKHCHGKVA